MTQQSKDVNNIDYSQVPDSLSPSEAEKENQQANQGKTEQEIQDAIKKQEEELNKIYEEEVIGDDYYIPKDQIGDRTDPDFIENETKAMGGDLSGGHIEPW